MIQRLIDQTMDAVLWISAVVLVCVTAFTFVSVLLRYIFVAPLPDHYDISRLTLGVLMAWGIAYCFARDRHIEVDILTGRFSLSAQRVVWALSALLGLALLAVVAWTLWRHGFALRAARESTFDLRLPVWPWVMLTAAGFAAAGVTLLLRLLAMILTAERPAGPGT